MSRIKRDPRSSGNAPMILALIAALVLFAMNLYMPKAEASELYVSHSWQEEYSARRPGQTYWPDNIVIELNQENAPVDASQWLYRAAWSWGQRTGKQITFVGNTTSQGVYNGGKITVAWRTQAQIHQITGSIFTAAVSLRWSSMETGFITGSIIYLPIDRPQCLEHALLHELGHSLGITGHEGARPEDVMYLDQVHCLPAITAQDVAMAPYVDHNCHAELLADGSLYIPAVEGWGVHLVNQNGLLVVKRAAPSAIQCPSARLVGADILLSDIRSPSGRWMGQITPAEGGWRVAWVEALH